MAVPVRAEESFGSNEFSGSGEITVPPGSVKVQSSSLASRGNYLTIKAAVLGPGDALYLWWGHIGLIIEDSLSGENRFYDWGVFSFDNENFYANFALGRLLYSCTVSFEEQTIARVMMENRDLTVYTLDLPPEARTEIMIFAENNVLPENKDYRYHHFRDNCSTRVIDIIDMAVGGQFKERYGNAPGRFTLRQHVRRHTWFSPFWDWALNFWMGRDIDRPITVWEEMFLPSEAGRNLADFTYTGPGGQERRLVSSVETLYKAQGRPGVLENPPGSWPGALGLGLAIAALFCVFRLMEQRAERRALKAGEGGKFWRVLSGCGQGFFGLFFGSAGLVLFFMTFFTDHDYTWHNSNILFVHPLLLAALPLGLSLAFKKRRKDTGRDREGRDREGRDREGRCSAAFLLKALWTIVSAGGVLSLLIKILPGFYQQNGPSQALVLPCALVLSFIPAWTGRLAAKLRAGKGRPA